MKNIHDWQALSPPCSRDLDQLRAAGILCLSHVLFLMGYSTYPFTLLCIGLEWASTHSRRA